MPVTKTAKRALRVSHRKKIVNDKTRESYEIAIRVAKKDKTAKAVTEAISTVDRAAKRNVIHKNKAGRLKSSLSKLLPKGDSKKTTQKASPKSKTKTSKKK